MYENGQIVFKDGKITRVVKTTDIPMLGSPSLHPDTVANNANIIADNISPPYIEALSTPIADVATFTGYEDAGAIRGGRGYLTVLEKNNSLTNWMVLYTKIPCNTN